MRPTESVYQGGCPPKATMPSSVDVNCDMEHESGYLQNWSQNSHQPLSLCHSETENYTEESHLDSGQGSLEQGQSQDVSDILYIDDDKARSDLGSFGQKDLQFSQDAQNTSSVNDDECSTTTRVLLGLDTILRDKVNVEVEGFRDTLQCLLDEQLNRIQHLIKLSADFTPHEPLSQSTTGEPEQIVGHDITSSQEEFTYDESVVDRQEVEKESLMNQSLLQLFMHASKITNTITLREEFHVQQP